MIFEQISVGGDRNYAYLIAEKQGGEAAVVDPAYDTELILDLIKEYKLTLKYIINTHDHYDHTDGNTRIKSSSAAKIVMHSSASGEIGINHGDELTIDNLTLKFLHTPGHTPDSICVLAGNKLISGDTLFVGKVGGTGYGQDAQDEYKSLHEKLMTLPDDTEVYPGHNYGVKESSTIGTEKRTNPFLLRETFEEFLDLKKNWLEYKRTHGIK
jgi:hydroxyacylglutathione hydrolase